MRSRREREDSGGIGQVRLSRGALFGLAQSFVITAKGVELPRFGGQFTAFTHMTGCGLVVEPRRGSISPSVPRKRGVPSSSSAEFEAA